VRWVNARVKRELVTLGGAVIFVVTKNQGGTGVLAKSAAISVQLQVIEPDWGNRWPHGRAQHTPIMTRIMAGSTQSSNNRDFLVRSKHPEKLPNPSIGRSCAVVRTGQPRRTRRAAPRLGRPRGENGVLGTRLHHGTGGSSTARFKLLDKFKGMKLVDED